MPKHTLDSFMEAAKPKDEDVAKAAMHGFVDKLQSAAEKMGGGHFNTDWNRMRALVSSVTVKHFRVLPPKIKLNADQARGPIIPPTIENTAHVQQASGIQSAFASHAGGRVVRLQVEDVHIPDDPAKHDFAHANPMFVFAHEMGHVMDIHDKMGNSNVRATKRGRYDDAFEADRNLHFARRDERLAIARKELEHPDYTRSKNQIDSGHVDKNFFDGLARQTGFSWADAHKVSESGDEDLYKNTGHVLPSWMTRTKEQKTASLIHGVRFGDWDRYHSGIAHFQNRGAADSHCAMSGDFSRTGGHTREYYYSEGYGKLGSAYAEKRMMSEMVANSTASNLGFIHPIQRVAMKTFFPHMEKAVDERISQHIDEKSS